MFYKGQISGYYQRLRDSLPQVWHVVLTDTGGPEGQVVVRGRSDFVNVNLKTWRNRNVYEKDDSVYTFFDKMETGSVDVVRQEIQGRQPSDSSQVIRRHGVGRHRIQVENDTTQWERQRET